MSNSLVPLEPLLVMVADIGSLVDRISAGVAPDFIVSMTGEEACNDYADNRAEHDATNARSNDDRDRDTRFPARNIRYQSLSEAVGCLRGLSDRGKTGGWPTTSTVDGSISPRITVGIG